MSDELRFLPGSRSQSADRRSDFDVTNTVKVSSVDAVRNEVQTLFQDAYPNSAFDSIWMAFHDFGELYAGKLSAYRRLHRKYLWLI